MAGNESNNEIIRTEYNPYAPTAEGVTYVRADGSRWVQRHGNYTKTGERLGKKVGNCIFDE